MRKSAFLDLLILAAVFWSVWSLRFVGVGNIGLWSMLAGVAAGVALLLMRGESFRDIGLRVEGGWGWTLSRVGEVGFLVFVLGFGSIGLVTALGMPPTTSVALTEQPDTLPLFLLDLLFGVWLGAAIGEEMFFRGFLISKFRTLFGGERGGLFATCLALLAQAAWFGSGHASQGLGGMIATGVIGLGLGVYFLTRARGSLIPMIIGHGLVNTISQTAYFFQN
ncbi:MAG: hypothetical protein Tsb0010_12990 [Parvularculaceae bacterium]